MRERLPLVDAEVRRDPAVARVFQDVLRWRGRVGMALRAMHETGFLGRYLPEFGRVTFLVQHDFFHRYTVDEHTLKAIEALDEVAAGESPAVRALGRVFDEVEDAAPLYLGLLLHDIGKGRGGGHVERGARLVPRACARLSLTGQQAEDVAFLVAAHLEMSQISQQRDLSEPALIESFAARVGRLDRLNQLMLLTYADHRGVGPGIWNEWKGTLLWELYNRTRERLAGHPMAEVPGAGGAGEGRGAAAAGARRGGGRAALRADARALHALDVCREHGAALPARGRARRRAGDARVARPARRSRHGADRARRGPAGAVRPHRGHAHRERRRHPLGRPVLARRQAGDRQLPGLGGREPPAGSPRPARAGRGSSCARRSPTGSTWPRPSSAGRPAARARCAAPWGRSARGPSVRFDHEASATATVIEVRAQDRPGLAFTLADALARLGLDIRFAKIATAKALALDVFYVTDDRGRKLEPASLPRVEAELLAVLAEGAPVPTAKEAR